MQFLREVDWSMLTKYFPQTNQKKMERQTAHTIFHELTLRKLIIVHTSDLLIIIRQSMYVFSQSWQKLCVNIYIYIHALLYEFCFLWFTNCVLLSDDNTLIPVGLWLLAFVLNNTLILGIWRSAIPHLPGCFCPWTFFQNIGFNMVPSDPFMSHLATYLGYSAGEALQLVVLATFGVMD